MHSTNGRNGKRKIKCLIETWIRFGDFLKTSLGKEGVQKAQEEGFLRLKAKIAHLLPVLTVVERGGASDPEALAAVRDITEMLNSFTTLATPEALTREETEEIIARWHSIFIFLNKLEGALKERRYGLMLGHEETRHEEDSVIGVFGSWFVRFAIGLVIVLACGALIGGLLGITLDEAVVAMKKGVSVVLGREPVAESGIGTQAGAALGATAGVTDSTTGAVTKKSAGTAVTSHGYARTQFADRGGIPTALRPLVREYGKHLTMIVFAIFLAGLVFLFFLRVK
ncbi:MAG: hypothetical protein NTX17_00330 [Candidatus Eisenbacteria bacterium]|nr:hypothetical protein [Candidatus Eisenbacteria bacterium]